MPPPKAKANGKAKASPNKQTSAKPKPKLHDVAAVAWSMYQCTRFLGGGARAQGKSHLPTFSDVFEAATLKVANAPSYRPCDGVCKQPGRKPRLR